MSHQGSRLVRARSLTLAATLVAAFGIFSLFVASAQAVPLAGSPNPLPGSSFEGGDANQAGAAPRLDWQNAPFVDHAPDPNANDNIFAGGSEGKENNPGNWNFATQDGGSTPGKNNILDAYSEIEPNTNDVFLHLAFTRGNPTGTTFMAFELNQRGDLWNNGKVNIPCRTTGDIIVSYQVSGNSPDVILQKWTTGTTDAETGCAKTGTLADYTAFVDNVDAQGGVNAGPIQNFLPSSFPWPGNTIPASLFGEGSLNLTRLLSGALGTPCFSFGSIWMHTRASTSDTSNLDDYIAPRALLVRNCSASGTKFHDLNGNGVKDAGEPGLAGFRMWADYDNDGVRDAGEPFDDTDASGNYTITNVQDPSGTYTIREQRTAGGGTGGWICSFPATSATGGDFPCAYPGINGATTPNPSGKDFGNFKPAVIKVAKQTVPNGASESFAFTSTIPDKANFQLSDDGVETTTVDPGTYTATETGHPDFDLTGIACTGDADSSGAGSTATFNAQSGETITCTFTNERKTGELTVRKVLDPANDGGMFDLKIGDEVVVDDGGHLAEATRTLPTGTGYTVAELGGTGTSLAKYDSAVECKDGDTIVKSDTGTSLAGVPVVQGANVICTFTNTRRPGTIEVVKDLNPASDEGTFDLKVGATVVKAGASDGQGGSTSVAPGDYTVSEAGANGTDLSKYDKSIECKDGDTVVESGTGASLAGVTVDSNRAIVCTITNERRNGSLTVVKDLVPAADGGRFDLKVGDDVVKAAAGDGDQGDKDVAPGDYTVSEAGANGTDLSKYDKSIECKDGDTVVESGTGASLAGVTVDSNRAIVCTITNERRTGSLTVVKDLVPAADGGRFDLKVGDDVVKAAAGDGDQADKDVAPGDYTVSEVGANTDLTKYDKSIACTRNGQPAESGDGASLAGVTVDSNDAVICTITNTRRTGELTVVKDLKPADDGGTFDLRIGDDVVKAAAGDGDSGSKTLAPGDYAVSELGANGTSLAKYDTSIACDNGQGGTGTSLAAVHVDSNDDITCTITNERRAGSITVVKDLVPAPDDGRFDLKVGDDVVKAAAGDGDQGTKAVAPGTYGVSEAGANGTDLAKYDKSIECKDGETIVKSGTGASLGGLEVDSDDAIVCTITNERRTGSLTVVKDLKPADDGGTFDLRVGDDVVAAGVGDGGQGDKDVAPGDYTVSEAGAGGTDLSKYDKSIACTRNGEPADNGTGASLAGVTVDSNDEVVCTITNERRAGTITVVKDLAPADDDGTFDLKVGDDVVKAGAGDGDQGTKAVAPGTYGVSEVAAGDTALGDYDSSVACLKNGNAYKSGDGTSLGGLDIDSGDAIVCTITNVRQGSVTVTKTEGGGALTRAWTFQLTGGPDDVEITKSTADGNPLAFGHLKPGTYTLCEIGLPEGWFSSLGQAVDGKVCVELALEAGEAEAVPVDNTRPETLVIKEGNLLVHHGDTITYTFDVSNKGNTPLKDVSVEDDRCDEDPVRDPANDQGNDGDEWLETGEVWRFTCTVVVPEEHSAEEENPILNVATARAVDKDGNEVTDTDDHKTTIIHPAMTVEKTGAAFGYAGDTVTYTFKATNTGDTALHDVSVSDNRCAPVTGPTVKSGGDADALLELGETWTYTCAKQIPAGHKIGDENPITNIATATGKDPLDKTVKDTDDHQVRVLHPAIDIEKTGPATAPVGSPLAYTLTVTNPGDVPFASQAVVVTDPRCEAPPAGPVKTGDATPGQLDPGDSWTYTCTAQTTGQPAGTFVNTANVTGTDPNGRKVTDTDAFPTTLEEQQVLPEEIVSGTARLRGPSGCVKKAFKATVRGRQIARVTFYVDGRKHKRVVAKAGQRVFKATIRPGSSVGVHRVKARIVFKASARTKARTLRLSYRKCVRQVVTPQFTG
jgi:hypothetical protein